MKEPSKPLVMVNIPNPITLTSSSNYISWKTQIEAILIGLDLYSYLDGTFLPPPITIFDGPNNAPLPNPAYQTWFHQDKLIFGALIGTLASSIVPLISQSKTTCEMWDTLTNTFASQQQQQSSMILLEGGTSAPQYQSCSRPTPSINFQTLTSPLFSAEEVSIITKKRKIIEDGDRNTNEKTPMGAFSNLPDDLLQYVLSFVDMKTAGRTSILSKKWRYIWTYQSDLDFQDPEFVMETDKQKIKSGANKYCKWVNHVIASHRAPLLNFMRIHFPLDGSDYVNNIIKWVKFALMREVANLELSMACAKGTYRVDPCTRLGLIIHIGIFTSYSTIIKSSHLKYLHLENVSTYGSFIEKVLSDCPNLEHLMLKTCIFYKLYLRRSNYITSGEEDFISMAYVGIKIVVSSPKLRYLGFFRCPYVKSLQISAPKLTSLLFIEKNKPGEVVYTSVPSLVDVTLVPSHCYHMFYNMHRSQGNFSFSRLEKLTLHWHLASYASHGLPELRVDNLNVLITLIEACPLLHMFKLELCHDMGPALKVAAANLKDIEIDNAKMKRHEHLKEVEIVGYDGSESVAKLALCLTHHMHTPMLHRIILDPRYPQLYGKLHELYNIKHSTKIGIARLRAKLLANHIRGGVNVVIP